MNRRSVCFATLSLALLATLVVLIRLEHRRTHLQGLYAQASAGNQAAWNELAHSRTLMAGHLIQQLALDSSADPSMRDASFAYIAADHFRQISLCRYIGEDNGALDEQAEEHFFSDLASQHNVSHECIHAALQRFIDLPSAPRPVHLYGFIETASVTPSPVVDALRERTSRLIAEHRQEAADVLRQRYGLGSPSPEAAALSAAVGLQLKESCPDIQRTEDAIEATGGLYAEDYHAAYATLCR